MCCRIFRCFGWIIDILQRILTFMLASILCLTLCCGFAIALGAGIAYGYHILVAEYLNLKQTDITVYVRRGQFADTPELKPQFRRTGADEPDIFSSNYTADYQDQKLIDNTRPLSDAWQKAQDSSNYAEKLNKYSKMKANIMRVFPNERDEAIGKLRSGELKDIVTTEKSVQLIPDRTGSPIDQPKMRNYKPEYRPPYSRSDDGNQDSLETRRSNRKQKHKKKKPDVKIEIDDDRSLYLQPNATKFLYTREDFEEKDVEPVNKPV